MNNRKKFFFSVNKLLLPVLGYEFLLKASALGLNDIMIFYI